MTCTTPWRLILSGNRCLPLETIVLLPFRECISHVFIVKTRGLNGWLAVWCRPMFRLRFIKVQFVSCGHALSPSVSYVLFSFINQWVKKKVLFSRSPRLSRSQHRRREIPRTPSRTIMPDETSWGLCWQGFWHWPCHASTCSFMWPHMLVPARQPVRRPLVRLPYRKLLCHIGSSRRSSHEKIA